MGNPAGLRSSSSQWGLSSEPAMYTLRAYMHFTSDSCTYDDDDDDYDDGHFDVIYDEHDREYDDDDEDNGNCHQSVRVFPQRLLH